MKKQILVLAAMLAIAGAAAAKKAPVVAEKETGRVGTIGLGYEKGFANDGAIEGRYWLNDTLGIKADLALNYDSRPDGSNAAGDVVNDTFTTFGLEGGVLMNLKRYQWVDIQALGQLGFCRDSSHYSRRAGSYPNYTTHSWDSDTTTLAAGVGLGFEAFIPVWPNISVSGMVGVSAEMSFCHNINDSGVNTTYFNFGNFDSPLTPASVAVHYYF